MIIRKLWSVFFMVSLLAASYEHPLRAADQVPAFIGIDQKKIDEYAQKVAQELKRNTYIRAGVVAVGLLSISLGAYVLFFRQAKAPEVPVPSVPVDLVKPSTDGIVESLAKNTIVLEKSNKTIDFLIAQLEENGHYLDGRKLSGMERLKSWGRYIGQSYATLAFGSFVAGTLTPLNKYFTKFDDAVNNTIDRVFHEQNIAWFLSTHTNVRELLDQVERHVQEHDVSMTTTTWNLYMQQIMSVLGFMNYKTALIEKKSVEQGEHAHLVIDALLKNMHEDINTMNAAAQQTSAVVTVLHDLRSSVEKALQDFAFTENLACY